MTIARSKQSFLLYRSRHFSSNIGQDDVSRSGTDPPGVFPRNVNTAPFRVDARRVVQSFHSFQNLCDFHRVFECVLNTRLDDRFVHPQVALIVSERSIAPMENLKALRRETERFVPLPEIREQTITEIEDPGPLVS